EDRRERRAGRTAAEALADLREDVREDEDEEERLHDRADDELAELPPEHAQVARQEREERRRLRAHSLYSRPVSVRNTVSRLGGWLEASRTSTPSSVAVCTSVANTRTTCSSRSTVRTPGSAAARSARAAGSPSIVTAITVSAPSVCLSSAGLPSASILPWSRIAIRWQRTSASSM